MEKVKVDKRFCGSKKKIKLAEYMARKLNQWVEWSEKNRKLNQWVEWYEKNKKLW